MLIILEPDISAEDEQSLTGRLRGAGLSLYPTTNRGRRAYGAIGPPTDLSPDAIAELPGVAQVRRIGVPFKLASRDFRDENTRIEIGDVTIGGDEVVLMAGPCAVESEQQVMAAAEAVSGAGARILRGGAFKPRSSPYSFQGLGEEGLRILRRAADRYDLLIVSELIDPDHIEMMCDYVDILQIGARNMQNFALLRALNRATRPILLKRGLAATVDELLMSAEYIMSGETWR